MEWLTIDSAPKDGTEVLCWRDDCGVFIASYTQLSELPLTQKDIDQLDEETLFAEDWFTQWPQAIRCDGSEEPTHWLAAPTATRRKAMSRRQRQRQQATQAKRQPAYMPDQLADVFAQMERERKEKELSNAQRRH